MTYARDKATLYPESRAVLDAFRCVRCGLHTLYFTRRPTLTPRHDILALEVAKLGVISVQVDTVEGMTVAALMCRLQLHASRRQAAGS